VGEVKLKTPSQDKTDIPGDRLQMLASRSTHTSCKLLNPVWGFVRQCSSMESWPW
jgi:hypothetical protein